MFSQCRSNADEHTLTQISFSTNYWRWNNIGSSTLNRRNSVNVVSTLFCQRWNNVDKHTSAQLSFSTKFQRWNSICSSTLNRRNQARNEDFFGAREVSWNGGTFINVSCVTNKRKVLQGKILVFFLQDLLKLHFK